MKEKQVFDPALETIWKFLRGDMEPQNFANWVYAQDNLESRLGETLYFETIDSNYSCSESLWEIKRKLKEYAERETESLCRCIRLGDMAVVDMFADEYFHHFEHIKKRGNPYWWLSLYLCQKCKQWWLVAQEERQNDVFCMRRLDNSTAQRLFDENIWPEDFDRYETLLLMGMKAGHQVRFVDPLNSSLVWTVADLAKERPGISISELAKLLNLDYDLAKDVARKANGKEKGKLNIKDSYP